MTYEHIKYYFEAGLWNAAMVQKAVKKGVITKDQCEAILSGTEPKDSPEAIAEEIINILTGEEG